LRNFGHSFASASKGVWRSSLLRTSSPRGMVSEKLEGLNSF